MDKWELGPVRDRRPLAVQVYDRLFDALVTPGNEGAEVPTEVALADRLGVSRTTVRQALALLEEDGTLERGPGRRRLVAGRRGTDVNNPPLEDMISAPGRITVEGVARRTLPATRWSSRLLAVSHESPVYVWESVVRAGGRVVASALELTTPEAAPQLEPRTDATMLRSLGPGFRARAMPTLCRLTPHTATTRSEFDEDIRTEGNAVVVTEVLSIQGRPSYLAKHVVSIAELSLTLFGSDPENA